MKIFVSHAWVNNSPDSMVLEFVDFLRQKGYEAECDVFYQQEKTAIHFTEMMATALKTAGKTIIVLSQNYKLKADAFQGGVGTEYRYIIDDFSRNENRYILVSFNGMNPNIIPDFLNGREIIDLKKDEKNGYKELFSKLSGTAKIAFSPVALQETTIEPEKIGSFNPTKSNDLSNKLGLNVSLSKPVSDLDKKRFLKNSFNQIIKLLKQLSEEFSSRNQYIHIDCDDIDSVTTIFEIYKNEKKIKSIQIWFGNMFGGSENGIFIGSDIGSKNSYSGMIVCDEENGMPILHFTFGAFLQNSNLSIVETVKHLWTSNFQIYLGME